MAPVLRTTRIFVFIPSLQCVQMVFINKYICAFWTFQHSALPLRLHQVQGAIVSYLTQNDPIGNAHVERERSTQSKAVSYIRDRATVSDL